MLLELLRACRKRTGKSPWLLIAGDAGQRVEASGFEWGRYTELLSSRWRKPATFDLHEHVRCPSRIAAVVNRSNIFYSLVDKNRRPEKQQPVVESEHVTGHALYVRVERTEQANGLVEQLAGLEGTAVIAAADEPPAWLDERCRKLVLTPGEAKGLEYQRVCVLDVGAAIEGLRRERARRQDAACGRRAGETAIDQLRVALSRATEDAGGRQRRTGRAQGPEHAGAGRRSRPLQPGRHHRPVRRRDGDARRAHDRTHPPGGGDRRGRPGPGLGDRQPDGRRNGRAGRAERRVRPRSAPRRARDADARSGPASRRRRGQGRQRASEGVAASRRGYGR